MNLYLHLFHGRDSTTQDMDGWGFNGPTFGPLQYVHTTYGHHVKLGFVNEADAAKFGLDPNFPELTTSQDCLEFQGKLYGDWSVSAGEPPKGLYRVDVIHNADGAVVHSERFEATTLEAEQALGNIWNSHWAGLEAGRYKAVLTDISGDGEYVWQTIEPEGDDE